MPRSLSQALTPLHRQVSSSTSTREQVHIPSLALLSGQVKKFNKNRKIVEEMTVVITATIESKIVVEAILNDNPIDSTIDHRDTT